jgi:hypothetical protein
MGQDEPRKGQGKAKKVGGGEAGKGGTGKDYH